MRQRRKGELVEVFVIISLWVIFRLLATPILGTGMNFTFTETKTQSTNVSIFVDMDRVNDSGSGPELCNSKGKRLGPGTFIGTVTYSSNNNGDKGSRIERSLQKIESVGSEKIIASDLVNGKKIEYTIKNGLWVSGDGSFFLLGAYSSECTSYSLENREVKYPLPLVRVFTFNVKYTSK